ncbi:uncharacterized protein LOC144046812 [Vanacampus margaritifer]
MKPQHRLIIFAANVVWMTGVQLNEDKRISQTPHDVFRKADDGDVTLSFTHNLTHYDTILWYRRVSGAARSLELVAVVNYDKALVEPTFRDRIYVSGNGRKAAHLRILVQRWPDNGGHFFAAANTHGHEGARRCPTKTLPER